MSMEGTKVKSMDTSDLVKTLLKADEECRVLREHVALLEKRSRLKQRDGRAIAAADSIDTNTAAKTKGSFLALPIEVVGELNARAGDVTLLLKEQKALLKERKQLQKILEESAADTVDAHEANTQLKQCIGFIDGQTIQSLKDAAEEVQERNGLKHEILMALRERESIQATLRRQTEYIRVFLDEMQSMKDLEERRDAALRQLEEKRNEMKVIRDELQDMQRRIQQADKDVENEKPVDELLLAQRAENERRIVVHRLEREEEGVRQNEISIRHRSVQIAKLERRIEMIGSAILSNESEEQERVDAEYVENLRKEILSLGRVLQRREAEQEVLDVEVADLDQRAIGLARTTANMKREMQRIEREHRKYTNAQKKELEAEQMDAEREIGEMEKEIEMLRRVTTHRRGQKAPVH